MLGTADTIPTNLVRLLPPESGRRLLLAKGEYVFAADDETCGLFQVETGLVRLVRRAIDGSDVTLHIARPGDMFAEASLFAERYHCDAIADQPTALLVFNKACVRAALGSDPIHALQPEDRRGSCPQLSTLAMRGRNGCGNRSALEDDRERTRADPRSALSHAGQA